MNKIIIVFLLLIITFRVKSQSNESLVRPQSASISITPPGTGDGSLIYKNSKMSLFNYEIDKWIQLRQEINLCDDQLSILHGNSVELEGLLGGRKGETVSWIGNKWKSDDLAFIYEGVPINFSLTEASSIYHSTLNNIDRLPNMLRDGMYVYAITASHINSGSQDFKEGGLSIININNIENMQFVAGVEAGEFADLFYNNHPTNDWFCSLGSVCKIGNYVYAGSLNGPAILDVSSINNPEFIRSKGISQTGVVVTDNIFVYHISNGLRVFQPQGDDLFLLGSAPFTYGVNDACISNNFLYIVGNSGLTVFDISNSSNPTFISHLSANNVPSFNFAQSIVIKGNRAYVGSLLSNSLAIIDISDPTNLTVNHTLASTNGTFNSCLIDLKIIGNMMYGLTNAAQSYVVFFDISDPNQTVRLDYIDLGENGFLGPNQDYDPFELEVISNQKLCISFQDKGITCYHVDYDKSYTGLGIATHSSSPTLDLENPLEVNGNASKIGSANWSTFSDQRVKKDIQAYNQGLEIIRQINPYQFNYRSNSGYSDTTTTYTGVMAQEMLHISPHSIKIVNDSKGSSGLENKLQYDSSNILWNLINAIKEIKYQEDEIEQLIQNEMLHKK